MRASPADKGGLTLVEVMVALAVFAVAVMALLKLSGENVRAAAAVRDAEIAAVVAENALAEAIILRNEYPLGDTAGSEEMAGRIWEWRVAIAETGVFAMQRIDVEVRAGDETRLAASAVGFRGRE